MDRPCLRGTRAVLALALAALGLAGCASAGSSHPASHLSAPAATAAPSEQTASPSSVPAQPAGTQVITYAPWAAAGTLGSRISAASTQSGSCFSTSSATTAAGAYRCTVGNSLYDPCFADATSSAGEVACPNPQNPDSVVVIKLTAPLPAPATAAGLPVIPWLLLLANGQQCETITGREERDLRMPRRRCVRPAGHEQGAVDGLLRAQRRPGIGHDAGDGDEGLRVSPGSRRACRDPGPRATMKHAHRRRGLD
jgi:hypothetical protein